MARGKAVAIVLDEMEKRELMALTRSYGAPKRLRKARAGLFTACLHGRRTANYPQLGQADEARREIAETPAPRPNVYDRRQTRNNADEKSAPEPPMLEFPADAQPTAKLIVRKRVI